MTIVSGDVQSGKLVKYAGLGCVSSSQGYSVPYEECLGCNSFEDTGNSDDDASNLAGWAVALIVVASLACCACCIGLVALLIFGTANVIAFICCRNTQSSNQQQLTHQQQHPTVVATPMGHSQYQAPVYGSGGSVPPAYGVQTETLSVQIPMEAKPGSLLQATKSNGQQVMHCYE